MPAVKHTIEVVKVSGALKYKHTASDGGNQGTNPGNVSIKSKSKDKIQWKSSLGNFAIIFGGASPFKNGKLILVANKHQSTGFEELAETGSTAPASFKYAFASLDGIQFEKEDPELEVTDDGGSSARKKKAPKKRKKTK